MTLAGLLLALVIGMLLGMLGGGGSILAVPVLAYVVGLEPKLALVASFGVVGVTSLAGAIPHMRARNVDLRGALVFAAGSALVSFAAGAWLSRALSGTMQMLLFAVIMLVAAAFMLRRRSVAETVEARRSTPLVLMAGALVGVLTGIAGVGGGFLIVPALTLLAGVPMRRAVGTSLAVIAMNSAFALLGYLVQPELRDALLETRVGGTSLPSFLALFTAVTIVGAIAGAATGGRMPVALLRRGFAVFLVVMAAYLVLRNV
jgi:uncharacterized membrane protein YfcA